MFHNTEVNMKMVETWMIVEVDAELATGDIIFLEDHGLEMKKIASCSLFLSFDMRSVLNLFYK